MFGTFLKIAVAFEVITQVKKIIESIPDMRCGYKEGKRQCKLQKTPQLENHASDNI